MSHLKVKVPHKINLKNVIDNRIAYSLGKAAISLGLFPERVTNAYVVPLSISGKNVFFDRETVQQK